MSRPSASTPPLTVHVRSGEASVSVDTRVLVHSEALKQSGIPTGAHVLLRASSQPWLAGTVWPDFEAEKLTVSVPSMLVDPATPCPRHVEVEWLRQVPMASDVHVTASDVPASHHELLRTVLLHTLIDIGAVYVPSTMSITFMGHTYPMHIVSATTSSSDALADAPLLVARHTCVHLSEAAAPPPSSLVNETAYGALGGLDAQIAAIRTLVELPLTQPALFEQYGLKPPRGVLLYGPPGTGKTSLARTVAASLHAHVLTINGPELSSVYHGETEAKLRSVFETAATYERCIVIMDEVDALAPRRDASAAMPSEGAGEVERRVVATLLTLLDGMASTRVVVIAATNRPNALDPALRRPGRLDREIEIGVPDVPARYAILQVLLQKVPHALQDDDVQALAARTHGYVGADLAALVREAGMVTIQRRVQAPLHESLGHLSLDAAPERVTMADFTAAQAVVRPSAMREVFVETPKVTWADIADEDHDEDDNNNAQPSIKRQIQQCVEWPLKHADTFARLGIDPPRGVLLYGPPGCSKTLTAKALARESGLNFLAVRGPELVSKYVGESERAIREVFRRARAAAPSIVFFDELDAISGVRSMDASSGSTDRIVASLLTEMDGIDAESHVVVVAATNRPECIDPALLRPGRMDRLLYVGAPSRSVRSKILALRMKRMRVADDVDVGAIAELADGCSGAEVVSICQEAGLRALHEDMHCDAVAHRHFADAARAMPRRITPSMLAQYDAWRTKMAL